MEFRQMLENDILIGIGDIEWHIAPKTTISTGCNPADLDRVSWRRQLSSSEREAIIRAQHDQEGHKKVVN